MILPVGSADAERGFSIMKHTRYDRRSSLKGSTLDKILRIRINGPDIGEFDPLRYARIWLQEGHMLTDAPESEKRIVLEKPKDKHDEMLEREITPDVSNGQFKGKLYLKGSNIF